jgi:hypothetical protein
MRKETKKAVEKPPFIFCPPRFYQALLEFWDRRAGLRPASHACTMAENVLFTTPVRPSGRMSCGRATENFA